MEKGRAEEEVDTFEVEIDVSFAECPCGSRKRPEKCCGALQPRTYSAKLDPRNYLESDGLAIGTNQTLKRIVNGKLEPIIGLAQLSQSYKRKGKAKNKVVVTGTSRGDYLFNPESLLVGFDHIFAIDTNTRLLGEDRVSVSGVVHGVLEAESDLVCLSYSPVFAMEFWNAQINPERLGWYALISAITGNPELSEKKIGVIVDSDLGELDGINERRTPLVEDYFLPEGLELIYATSDVAPNATNKLIKLCDKLASQKLAEIISDPRMETLNDTSYPCDRFRQWNP